MPGFNPKILTANDLASGLVVYLGPDARWVDQLKDALLISDPVSANDCLAWAETQGARIVGPYLIDADLAADGTPIPQHFREGFRMRGPSNQFHGKQAAPH